MLRVRSLLLLLTRTQSWVDALFMAMSTYSRLGNVTEDSNYRSSILAKQWMNFNASAIAPADAQNRGVAEGNGRTFGFWNASDHLFYRDDSFIFSRVYWARGNGWAIMALVAAIEHASDTDPHHVVYRSIYRELAAQVVEVRIQGLSVAHVATSRLTPAEFWCLNKRLFDGCPVL